MRWLRWIAGFLVASVVAVGVTLFDSDLGWTHPPHAVFIQQLDRASELGTGWLLANQKWINATSNTKIVYMVSDMAHMSGDPRPQAIVSDYLKTRVGEDFWLRLINSSATDRPAGNLKNWCDYCLWMGYSLAPDQVPLTPTELSNMLSPDKYVWGSRTHQLLSLIFYRDRGHHSPEINHLIDHLCEGVAREEEADIRVTDLYLQRVAFLLAAGRPDLVKRRWVERILADQKPDGGWVPSWYGWGQDLFNFHFSIDETIPHTTIQGVWALYMIKYRYPGWIEQNYP